MIRVGQERAFEALVDRYHVRLLAFCRGMLSSAEDAEDVLQEVFVAAHKAILSDNRAINARPWLYRIARNRCLNHLRKPVPEGQDTMDVHPHENGTSVAEKVQKRAEFRALILDVQGLPETQRSALLLREIDALSYEEIAIAMDTTVPAVKSLLVRARMSLADASHGRHLTCDEVHLELAEATEGLRKVSGPARFHMKDCERCRKYRTELRRNGKALAALVPIGPLAVLAHTLSSKLGVGGAKAGGSASAGGAGVGAGGAGAGGTAVTGAAAGGGGLGLAGGGAAGLGGAALGAKAAAGMASMALLTAGAVEVQHITSVQSPVRSPGIEQDATAMVGPADRAMHGSVQVGAPAPAVEVPAPPENPPPPEPPATEAPTEPSPDVAATPEPAPTPPADPPVDDVAVGTPDSGTGEVPTNPGDSDGVIIPNPPSDPPVDPPADPGDPPDAVPPDDGYGPAPKS
jgi:RNA polymerase sigma factor (sigma-70 family)